MKLEMGRLGRTEAGNWLPGGCFPGVGQNCGKLRELLVIGSWLGRERGGSVLHR